MIWFFESIITQLLRNMEGPIHPRTSGKFILPPTPIATFLLFRSPTWQTAARIPFPTSLPALSWAGSILNLFFLMKFSAEGFLTQRYSGEPLLRLKRNLPSILPRCPYVSEINNVASIIGRGDDSTIYIDACLFCLWPLA